MSGSDLQDFAFVIRQFVFNEPPERLFAYGVALLAFVGASAVARWFAVAFVQKSASAGWGTLKFLGRGVKRLCVSKPVEVSLFAQTILDSLENDPLEIKEGLLHAPAFRVSDCGRFIYADTMNPCNKANLLTPAEGRLVQDKTKEMWGVVAAANREAERQRLIRNITHKPQEDAFKVMRASYESQINQLRDESKALRASGQVGTIVTNGRLDVPPVGHWSLGFGRSQHGQT